MRKYMSHYFIHFRKLFIIILSCWVIAIGCVWDEVGYCAGTSSNASSTASTSNGSLPGCIGSVCTSSQSEFMGSALASGLGIVSIYDVNLPIGGTVFRISINNPDFPSPTDLLKLTDQGNQNLGGSLNIDNNNQNNGSGPSLSFGSYINPKKTVSVQGMGSNVSESGANPKGLDFYVNNLPVMSVTSSGLVGMNTTAPAATLEVNGSEKVDQNLTMRAGSNLSAGNLLQVNGSAQFTGGVTFNGGLTVSGGTTTNIPYGCQLVSASNSKQVFCETSNQVAISGGVTCPSGKGISASNWVAAGYMGDSNPGWSAACGSSVPSAVYAICCGGIVKASQ